MQQRDIIKAEIERLGRVLGKLITLVTGAAGGDMNPAEVRQVIQDRLRNDLGLAPDDLLRLSRAELIAKLDNLQLEPLHLDQLGDFLTAWAEEEEDLEVCSLLRQRALLLFDLAGERSGVYDPERVRKEKALRALQV